VLIARAAAMGSAVYACGSILPWILLASAPNERETCASTDRKGKGLIFLPLLPTLTARHRRGSPDSITATGCSENWFEMWRMQVPQTDSRVLLGPVSPLNRASGKVRHFETFKV